MILLSQASIADVYLHMPRGSSTRAHYSYGDENYNECSQQQLQCARYVLYRGQYVCSQYVRTEVILTECQ